MIAIYAQRCDARAFAIRSALLAADVPCFLIGPEFGFASVAYRVPFVCFFENAARSGDSLRRKIPPEKGISFGEDTTPQSAVAALKLAYYRRFQQDMEYAHEGGIRFAERRVFFRAHELHLTKTESLILRLLFHSRGAYFTAEEVAAACLARGRGVVAVHICNINNKARFVLDTPLIETRRFSGYRIN